MHYTQLADGFQLASKPGVDPGFSEEKLKTIGNLPPAEKNPLGFPVALCVVEQRRAQREKGRGLFEGRSPEFRSPPLRTSSAEHPATPGDVAGAPSSWVLLLGKTRRSTSPAGETQRFSDHLRQRSQTARR